MKLSYNVPTQTFALDATPAELAEVNATVLNNIHFALTKLCAALKDGTIDVVDHVVDLGHKP